MKHLILIAALLVSGVINSQTNYEKGMQKAFELWSANKIDEAENLFERIAKAEPNEWLPNYYVAQINSNKSWDEKDAIVLKAQLDKAETYINLAATISKDNPEIMVLQALVFTNWVAHDGMTYGMKYGAKISELYNKAYSLSPENPRALYCKTEWEIGSARYFGKDTTPFCKDLEKAVELFVKFKPESSFHPNWGKDRTEMLLKDCK